MSALKGFDHRAELHMISEHETLLTCKVIHRYIYIMIQFPLSVLTFPGVSPKHSTFLLDNGQQSFGVTRPQ